jgi:hypothetical protein
MQSIQVKYLKVRFKKVKKTTDGLSVDSILFNSSTMRSRDDDLDSCVLVIEFSDFSSILNPNWLAKRILNMRKGSSE